MQMDPQRSLWCTRLTRTAADNYQCLPHALAMFGTVTEAGSDAIKFDSASSDYLGGVLSSPKTGVLSAA